MSEPGPKRGTPGAIENHTGSRWHTVALQHDSATNKFHIAHFRGLNPTRTSSQFLRPPARACCPGWAFEAVTCKARFRRFPRNGMSSFTMMSLRFRIQCQRNAPCRCGVGVWVKGFTRALGWLAVHETCELVPNGNGQVCGLMRVLPCVMPFPEERIARECMS